MQAAIMSMLVGISFLSLAWFALGLARREGNSRHMRIALGAAVGILAAFVVLVMRTDLIPDGMEQALAVGVVLLTAMLIGFAAWYLSSSI